MNQKYTPQHKLDLLLFTVTPKEVIQAENAGIDGIIVDWENHGKKARQNNFDTQINHYSYADLCRVRENATRISVVCRINAFNEYLSDKEIDLAIRGGAEEIFLPMVKSRKEVELVLNYIGARAKLSILIETQQALDCMSELATLPLNRIYVGLNDLHIQQKSPNIFFPLINDTVNQVRQAFNNIPVGVGGRTAPSSGAPIKSQLLINEYARLNIDFSFLRRTFLADCQLRSMESMVKQIQTSYQNARQRTIDIQNSDFVTFKNQVYSWNTYVRES